MFCCQEKGNDHNMVFPYIGLSGASSTFYEHCEAIVTLKNKFEGNIGKRRYSPGLLIERSTNVYNLS